MSLTSLAPAGPSLTPWVQLNSTLIPTNITSSCASFLQSLNADATLASCVGPLINTTSTFSPTSGTTLSSSDISYTLATLCKSTAGCTDASVRPWLTSFYASCQAELTSASGYNAQVRELYDILYVVNPLQHAVCSIDSSNQKFCVNEIYAAETGSNSSSTNATSISANASATGSAATASASAGNSSTFVLAAVKPAVNPIDFAAANLYVTISTPIAALQRRVVSYLTSRQDQSYNTAQIITPNATTYRSTNLPFLFLQPDMSASALCTPCTREVMANYIKWELSVPYALGLAQSPILGGQQTLWTAINSTCGVSFVNAITSQVGGTFTPSNSTSGTSVNFAASPVVPVVAAMVAGAVAFFA